MTVKNSKDIGDRGGLEAPVQFLNAHASLGNVLSSKAFVSDSL